MSWALKDADKLGAVKVFSFDEDPVALDAIKDGFCEGHCAGSYCSDMMPSDIYGHRSG